MKIIQKISLRSTHAFSEFFLKYIEQDPSLRSFYSQHPSPENFSNQINQKASTFSAAARGVLVKVLQQQYQNVDVIPTAVEKNLSALLHKDTFTITTGHQLNIFTGPLYFIYKIVTVINTCQRLRTQYPQHQFVPVYWMASEDHDYEEIKSLKLNGSTFTWETEQKGAVGRFDPSGIKKILEQLPGDVSIFQEAYLKSKTLSDAVRVYVNHLFGSYGLVVMDADATELKACFQSIVHDDIFENTPYKIVSKTNADLSSRGYHPQVNPREINFFYLGDQLRARIEQTKEGYALVDYTTRFSKPQIEKEISEAAEKFSPNVILRPLYQETILPNLAYVGGPAELVYWLELKNLFEHYHLPFPILMPRNFALIVDAPSGRKLAKTGLAISDFFEEKNYIYNQWITKHSEHDLTLGKTMKDVAKLFQEIHGRSSKIDATLGPMTLAETKRVQHILEKIEVKMVRAEKRKQGDRLRQIESLKDHLFPGGGLQERLDNFLMFYQQDPSFIKMLIENFDPFDFRFNVLEYD